MLYLLDANVLISAHELHYPLDRIPQFWTWLLAQCDVGNTKLPFEIFGEVANSTGDLKNWLATPDHSKKLKWPGKRMESSCRTCNLRLRS